MVMLREFDALIPWPLEQLLSVFVMLSGWVIAVSVWRLLGVSERVYWRGYVYAYVWKVDVDGRWQIERKKELLVYMSEGRRLIPLHAMTMLGYE